MYPFHIYIQRCYRNIQISQLPSSLSAGALSDFKIYCQIRKRWHTPGLDMDKSTKTAFVFPNGSLTADTYTVPTHQRMYQLTKHCHPKQTVCSTTAMCEASERILVQSCQVNSIYETALCTHPKQAAVTSSHPP